MTRIIRSRMTEVRDLKVYNKDQKSKIIKDFRLLFRVLLAAGLTFPSLNDRKLKTKVCQKLLETIMNMMALFVILVNLFFWQRRYSSVTLHLSTSLTICFALLVRFVLLLCRKDVPRMVQNLILLHDEIIYKKPVKSLRHSILLGCFVSMFLTVFASVLDGYRLMVDQAKGEHSVLFMININDPDGRYQRGIFWLLMCLVPIKMYFAYGVSVMILIFCCFVYTVAKRILLVFHELINQCNRDDKDVLISSKLLSTYLTYYNRISQCIAEIDDVLSPCVLLLYGLMVSGQFYTLTVLISNDTEATSLTTLLHNAIVFLLTTAAFLVITLTASKVTEVSENVKRSLQKLSEKINGRNDDGAFGGPNGSNIYLILISILSGSHLCFTGWKMFNINRSFILTTMGVMISYGIIIIQIGRKYSNSPETKSF